LSVKNSIIISRANKNTNRKQENNTNKISSYFAKEERTKQYRALNQKIAKMSANIMKSTKLSHSGLPKMKRKNFGGSFGGTFFQVYLCHITDDDGK